MQKLYIGKVKEVNKQEIYKLLMQYGLIKSFEDKDSFCFVEYYYESDARMAQYELDGRSVCNTRIVVQFSKALMKQEDLLKEALPSSTRKIYVGNLNHKFTSQELVEIFNRFGKILDIIFKETYALIEYPTQQCATEAILYMNEKNCKGEILKVDLQKTYDEVLSSSNRIYIGKIGNLKKMDLILNFGQFGFIEDISVKDDLYAFIQYRNNLHASRAIKEMNNTEIKGNRIQVQEARSKNHLPLNFNISQYLPQHSNLLDQLAPNQLLNKGHEENKNNLVQKPSRSRSRSKEKKQSANGLAILKDLELT
ncbi:unnamed protein product [Paramecium sonneborni]|uniref:RRM domain-containing protein n=1 Tax=Paramecium sonneborni TaxID=65129 RepID=A0A8S1KR74_9CILI|nr:unnamed protein product [Paramecium sonneborni]